MQPTASRAHGVCVFALLCSAPLLSLSCARLAGRVAHVERAKSTARARPTNYNAGLSICAVLVLVRVQMDQTSRRTDERAVCAYHASMITTKQASERARSGPTVHSNYRRRHARARARGAAQVRKYACTSTKRRQTNERVRNRDRTPTRGTSTVHNAASHWAPSAPDR